MSRRSSQRLRAASAAPATVAAAEPLESRVLLTTLYIDYGDRFPGGVLNTTVGAIDNTTSGSNPNIDGPRRLRRSGIDKVQLEANPRRIPQK